jgi:hypothetical protein
MPHLEPDNCGNYVVQQEPCDDEITLKVKRGALKSRQGDMVIYNVEWLKKNWQMEMDIVCGVKPCEDAYDKVLAYLKENVDDFPDYHEAIEAVLKMKGGE